MAEQVPINPLENPNVQGTYAALITHPAYYYLYGLYADYPINNAYHRYRENRERIQRTLRTLQPVMERLPVYRKTWALRLFTERFSRERFPPQLYNEAWRQLGELIAAAGPPARQRLWRPRAIHPRRAEPPAAPAGEAPPVPPFPKSPADYSQEV